MHQAVLSGSVMATEFLVLNSSRIDSKDCQGDTALHLAAQLGYTGQVSEGRNHESGWYYAHTCKSSNSSVVAYYSFLQVCLLLKHRADHHLTNHADRRPLDIAVTNSDADIVTLLRLAALNEGTANNIET